jgi:ligand-binding SRPBCC domain-containing protein
MKFYHLEQVQDLPISQGVAWDFFSNPHNLPKLTPPAIQITLQGQVSPVMYAGQLIEYRLRVMPGIWQRWLTEIKHVVPQCEFVDEQRYGPYRFLFHRHQFLPISGGTRVVDHMTYALPFDPFSRPAQALLVAPKLRQVFAYRRQALTALFGTMADGAG